LQTAVGNAAVARLLAAGTPTPGIQRAPAVKDEERLESARFAGNERLQNAFHDNPSLTAHDGGEPVRLLQEALVAAGLPMPRSTKPDNSLDGVWGSETTSTVRLFQDHDGIRPLGGGEAGRKTLGALDKVPPKQRRISQDEFRLTLAQTWGVQIVREGTFEDQAGINARKGADGRPMVKKPLTKDRWKPFQLPRESELYADILDAFDQVASALGGIAQVKEIVFLDTGFDVDSAGEVVAAPGEGASFGAGQLTIFREVTKGNLIPSRRSGRKESELRDPDARDATLHNVAHELGHGVAEVALGPDGKSGVDPQVFADYRTAVGWVNGQLFDIDKKVVQDAVRENRPPPASERITRFNFNEARWGEQPLSGYMTTDPSEDLPEAISFFVTMPRLLQARSPRRFAFVETHQALWRRGLRSQATISPP
jgi:peptidoglycan hydrolase-like protein with peptidoglycan-binding domain